jgi:exodeoxyribonuclease VII large subunit
MAARLDAQGRRAVVTRARTLAALSRAPAAHVDRHRVKLHQQLREIRASAARGLATRDQRAAAARLLHHAVPAAHHAARLDHFLIALDAHDPQRTLERGYARVEAPDGTPVTSAETARTLDAMTVRFSDDQVQVRRA